MRIRYLLLLAAILACFSTSRADTVSNFTFTYSLGGVTQSDFFSVPQTTLLFLPGETHFSFPVQVTDAYSSTSDNGYFSYPTDPLIALSLEDSHGQTIDTFFLSFPSKSIFTRHDMFTGPGEQGYLGSYIRFQQGTYTPVQSFVAFGGTQLALDQSSLNITNVTSVTPEPSTLLLLGSGLGMTVTLRRRLLARLGANSL